MANFYISSNKYSLQERQTKLNGKVYDVVFRIVTMDGIEKQKKLSGYKTKALAKEVATNGVTVNSVSPGNVNPIAEDGYDSTQESSMNYSARTGTPMENAELICFLASNEAAFISGQNIQIDGCRKSI